MKNNKVIVILGPTSSGKSDVAIKLAKKFAGEVISADSRQIYRGMDVGTGKVSKAEQKSVKHHLIDLVNPTQKYNVSNFKKDTYKIIKDIFKRRKLPIICGGTGFWIKAVVDNINFPEVKPNWALRNKLRNKSAEELFKMLTKLDPKRAKKIDKYNKVRLIRAIEICKAIKKVPPPPSGEDKGEGNYDFLQIGIKLPKENLYKNIKNRLQKRFKQGMIEEVSKLKKSRLSWKIIQSFGLGYYWIPLFLQNKLGKEELFEKIFQAEKNYAKRQMTWFKKDKRIKWLKNYQDIERRTAKFISK